MTSKLWEAHSRLYRRRSLQVNIRWKGLDEIYKIYILSHRSDLKISAKKRQIFWPNEKMKIHFFRFFCIFCVDFFVFSPKFWWNFFRISRQIPENDAICRYFNQICEKSSENCRNFRNRWKIFIIFHYFSFVSLVTGRWPRENDAAARYARHLRIIRRAGVWNVWVSDTQAEPKYSLSQTRSRER